MKEIVARAIAELRGVFPSAQANSMPDGGANVTIPDFFFGEAWNPSTGPLSTAVQFQYPNSDVYPFFGPPGLERVRGGAVTGLTASMWDGKPATQLSIRQRGGWNPNNHTLLLAILSVQNYLRNQS